MTNKLNNKKENNEMGEVINMKKVSYVEKYMEILNKVFNEESVYLRSFGGKVQTFINGNGPVESLKLNIPDVVIVGNDVKSGELEVEIRDEIYVSRRYESEKLPSDIKDMTVSDMSYNRETEELTKQAGVWVARYDYFMGKELSDNASETINGEFSEHGIEKIFSEAREKFERNKVSKKVSQAAYVNPETFNLLIDSGLIVANENDISNFDIKETYNFKGFDIIKTRYFHFDESEHIYFVADGVGVSGLGVPNSEVKASLDSVGDAVTEDGRVASYIPSKNKKAIIKAVLKQ